MKPSKPIALLVCMIATAGATAAASASTVYKWVDEKGVVNYTTTPPSNRKAAAVDVAPPVAGQGAVVDYDEARYWRARSEREAASDYALERLRRETEQMRQGRLRQEIAAAERASSQKSALQMAMDQCRAERRVDCETTAGADGYGGSLYTYPPIVVVTRRPAVVAPPGPYFSVTPNFTPGFSKPLIYSTPMR